MMTKQEKHSLVVAVNILRTALKKLAIAIDKADTFDSDESYKLLRVESLIMKINFEELINEIAKETMPF